MSVTGTAATIQTVQRVSAVGFVGGFTNPSVPNLTDFRDFLTTSVQIPESALPATSPYPQYALSQAVALVIPSGAGILYTLACYNGATHILLANTPDVLGQNWFATFRADNALVKTSTGLVASTSDNGTSTTLTSPDWAQRITVGQLGFMKTPWGREYLSYQMSYGPSIVGLS